MAKTPAWAVRITSHCPCIFQIEKHYSMDDSESARSDLVTALSRIVSAHLGNNNTTMSVQDVPDFIRQVHRTLAGLDDRTSRDNAQDDAKEAPPTPAVSIEDSVRTDHLVCLEDGKKLKMLKRHLRTRYDMTPNDYRRKWGLPSDYPMVAPDYAARRANIAHRIGLGTHGSRPIDPAPAVPPEQGNGKPRSSTEPARPASRLTKRSVVRATSRSRPSQKD